MCPTWLGLGDLDKVMKKGQMYRHTYRKTGIMWAVFFLMEGINCTQNHIVSILYIWIKEVSLSYTAEQGGRLANLDRKCLWGSSLRLLLPRRRKLWLIISIYFYTLSIICKYSYLDQRKVWLSLSLTQRKLFCSHWSEPLGTLIFLFPCQITQIHSGIHLFSTSI